MLKRYLSHLPVHLINLTGVALFVLCVARRTKESKLVAGSSAVGEIGGLASPFGTLDRLQPAVAMITIAAP